MRLLWIAHAVAALLLLAACGSSSDDSPSTSAPATTASRTARPSQTEAFNAQGVRYCEFVPGVSEPGEMPDEVTNPPDATPFPTPTLPASSAVSPDTTQRQLAIFDAVRRSVEDLYLYPDFGGRGWQSTADQYRALIEGGLTDEAFYGAMAQLIRELGDEHSYFQNPTEVAADEAQRAGGENFVGIGIVGIPIAGTQTGAVMTIFPGSPAEESGLRLHDHLLEVDGQPYRDDSGRARSLGPEGTSFELTYRRLGEPEQTMTVTRRAVSGFTPVDYCVVRDANVGYIMLPTFLDTNVDDAVRAALQDMTAEGPLDGLILDNRLNGGGSGDVTQATLSFFTSGFQGGSAGPGVRATSTSRRRISAAHSPSRSLCSQTATPLPTPKSSLALSNSAAEPRSLVAGPRETSRR